MALSCRWCCSKDHAPAKQPDKANIPLLNKFGKYGCPHPGCTSKGASRPKDLLTHYKTQHPGVPYPYAKDNTLVCGHDGCKATFTKGRDRLAHYKATHQGKSPEIPRAPSTGPTETIRHCVSECPALAETRAQFQIPAIAGVPYVDHATKHMRSICRFVLQITKR